MPTVKCEQCGKEFNKPLSQIKRSKQNFCCLDCFHKLRKLPNEYILKESYAEMVIRSKKYGEKIAFIDLEDVNKCKSKHWILQFCKDLNNFYVKDTSNRTKQLLLHRFLTNFPCGMVVDHLNHNTLDNRKSNLRICSQRENIQNMKLHKLNKSGFTGVSKTNSNKYFAVICVNYKLINLGLFKTLDEAVEARKNGEEKYFRHKKTA